jgi:hypothetical protein
MGEIVSRRNKRASGFSRRHLMLAGAAAGASSFAQAPAPAAGDTREAVRLQWQGISTELRKFKLPVMLDPAFAFRP